MLNSSAYVPAAMKSEEKGQACGGLHHRVFRKEQSQHRYEGRSCAAGGSFLRRGWSCIWEPAVPTHCARSILAFRGRAGAGIKSTGPGFSVSDIVRLRVYLPDMERPILFPVFCYTAGCGAASFETVSWPAGNTYSTGNCMLGNSLAMVWLSYVLSSH